MPEGFSTSRGCGAAWGCDSTKLTSQDRRSLFPFVLLLLLVRADNPKHHSESQSCPGQGRHHTRRSLVEIENNESSNEGQECNQHDGLHLHDSAAVMPYYKQRVLEFECNKHGEHHP